MSVLIKVHPRSLSCRGLCPGQTALNVLNYTLRYISQCSLLGV